MRQGQVSACPLVMLTHFTPFPSRYRSPLLWAILAMLAGLLLAYLPLLWAVILLISLSLIIITLIDPLIGITIVLVLGPTKPLTDYFVPELPQDLGQISLAVVLGSFILHAVHRRLSRIPSSPINFPLLLFLFAALFSSVDALSIGFALKETLKWAELLLMMWLVIDLATPHRWFIVVGGVFGAALLQAVIGIWQFGLRGDGPEHFLILDGRFYRAYGTFEQPNPYGGFLGLILPLAIALTLAALERWLLPAISMIRSRRYDRIPHTLRALITPNIAPLLLFGFVAFMLGTALIMSWSRGAWLGSGVAVLAILFAYPRRAWIGALVVSIALLGGLAALSFDLLPTSITNRLTGFADDFQTFDVRGVDITPDNYAVIERLAHWQAAQSMAQYNFWFGVGIGNYEPVYPVYALVNWPYPLGHAHNFYLNTLAEMGIIGLIAYLVVWIVIFYHTWQVTRTADLWVRSVAIGLIGTWTHLSVHSLLDKLYVANLHLHIGALLGVLGILIALRQGGLQSSDGNH